MANPSTLATLTFNSSLLTGVGSIRARAERPVLDATPLGQDYPSRQRGAFDVAGSADVYFDKSDHAALVNHLKSKTAAQTMTITWNTGETWSGPAIISSVDAVAQVGDLVRATFEFSADGDWTSGT